LSSSYSSPSSQQLPVVLGVVCSLEDPSLIQVVIDVILLLPVIEADVGVVPPIVDPSLVQVVIVAIPLLPVVEDDVGVVTLY